MHFISQTGRVKDSVLKFIEACNEFDNFPTASINFLNCYINTLGDKIALGNNNQVVEIVKK